MDDSATGAQTVDDPRAYIAGDRRRALAAGREMAEQVAGAAVFADISGFTPLTEALVTELGPRRGPEELVRILDGLWLGIIGDLQSHGGEVLYFSGDAITGWIDGDDGVAAAAAALAIQDTFATIGRVTTAGGSTIQLGIKISLAVGEARRFVVGDPDIQLIDVLAGSLMDDLAAAEGFAEKGEVILDRSAMERLGDRAVLGDMRSDSDGRRYGVLDSLTVEAAPLGVTTEFEDLDEERIRRWLLPTVYERLAGGGGGLFAELRRVNPMFVSFGGMDFDSDPDAPEKLDVFVRLVQSIFDRYGGSLLQLTLGDKGAYLYGVFGSPRTYEDDAVRAVRTALEIQDLVHRTAAVDIQIGISAGQVFSGTQGHPLRRTFACTGDPVNLAARLMGKARPGEVYVAGEAVDATGERFQWHELEPLTLKGKSATVAASALVGTRDHVQRSERYPLPMIGRDAELGLIQDRLERALTGARSVVGISADPGLGKSRLVAEVVRRVRSGGRLVAFGESQPFGQTTSYLPWREPWRLLLGLGPVPASGDLRIVEDALGELGSAAVHRAPLLSTVLGIDIPDNETTAAFDAKLRKTSLETLLSDILRSVASSRPLVVVLEDSHWIDEASLDLLDVLVRESGELPVLFVVAYRSEISDGTRDRIRALDSFEELTLRELTQAQIEQVIAAKLGQQFGSGVTPAAEVISLVSSRGQGNPFYIEELINYLRRSGVDISDGSVVATLDLPPSLQTLVLSRIDALDERPRRTLKIASVVGREFDAPTLPEVYPDLGDLDDVATHLVALREADLVAHDREEDNSWVFRHAVTRDVAYESIPYSVRSSVHDSTGAYIERRNPDAIDFELDLLAHHYWHGATPDKKVEYQRRAGDAAKASYANTAAIEYFERLSTIVEGSGRTRTLLDLGEVLETVGDWSRAEEVETEALTLAEQAGDRASVAWSEVALAEVARKQGRYDEATDRLARAATIFEEVGDDAGQGRVFHLGGTLAAQRGDLDAARETYERSLEIRERLADDAASAAVLSNLGVVAEYSGDLEAARGFHERALEARTSIGDKWALSISNTNLGTIALLQERFAEARDLMAEALRLAEEVGDAWVVAVDHSNLANALRGLGEAGEAKRHYAISARDYVRYGDRWATAFLLEDVALLAAQSGDVETAIAFLGSADTMRDEIDTPRSESVADDLRRRVVEADSGMSAARRNSARETGRSRDFEAALGAVSAYCA